MKNTAVILLMLVFSLQAQGQKIFPEPHDSLPAPSYFRADTFFSADKSIGLFDEGFDLDVNLETDHLAILIDSISGGWTAPNLRHLQINWNISPDETDSAKSIVIRKVISQISRLQDVKKNTKLESLSFWVGDGLFITSRDKFEYFDKKGQKQNLERAFNALQPELAKLPFELAVYSTLWGW
ncbi:MAG TPA: hypothetical protein VD927_02545 [Chryseosolibacter sp.]|nr:hypothetical protein [Chryseosolibacter sp.]